MSNIQCIWQILDIFMPQKNDFKSNFSSVIIGKMGLIFCDLHEMEKWDLFFVIYPIL